MQHDTTDCGRIAAATDGGRSDDDSPALTTYTDGEYGYRIAYPIGWSVGRNMMGATTFEATESSDAGVAVFVEQDGPTADSAATLLDDHDDGSVHALDVLAQRETELENGRTARVVECIDRSDPHDHWRLSYLFVRDGETHYTIGMAWTDDAFDMTATAILESFALGAK